MAAPESVQESAKLADQLIARRVEAKTPSGDPTAPIVPAQPLSAVPTSTVPVNEPPQLANPYATNPNPARVQPVQESSQGDWKHKYGVLQGMFDKTRADDRDRITQLESQNALLSRMADPTTKQDTFHPTVTPPPDNYGLSDDEIEELGGVDFVKAIGKISAAGAAQEIQSLSQQVVELESTQNETLDTIFYSRLSELCPDWRLINKDPQFDLWLKGNEGFSGIPMQSFLVNAYEERDAATTARYFVQFQGLQTSPPNLNQDVVSEIVPLPQGGGGPPIVHNKPIYTPASIAQFFKDRGLGKFKGKEAEAEAIEADIFAAQKEGRINRARPM